MATTMEPETRRDPGAKTPPPRVTEAVKPGGRRRTAFVIMGVVLVALAALGARRWIFSLSHQSTDDAQVDGHIVPILPKVGGFVTEIRVDRSEEHTSELQSRVDLVCRLLLEKKTKKIT